MTRKPTISLTTSKRPAVEVVQDDEPRHVAGAEIETDALQRPNAAEVLVDLGDGDKGGVVRRPRRRGLSRHRATIRPGYWMASGWSFRNASTLSLVTTTAVTSTALGCQALPAAIASSMMPSIL